MSETSKYAAQTEWNRENTMQIKLKLNKKTDADIIKRLDEEAHVATYIKRLIREDAEREGKENMTVKIYRNYGVLAHEKETVYTVGHPADTEAYDVSEYEISPDLKPYISEMQDVCVELDGETYPLSDVISEQNGEPCVRWYNGKSVKWKYIGKVIAK